MRGVTLGAACPVFFVLTMLAASPQSHRKSELTYMHAEQVLRRLEVKPRSQRTRMDYEHALNAYRAVYHGDPASPDAAHSIASTAYLLASAGRCFHQEKLSHDAVAQWEFLRRQYPTSPLRKRALFEEAQLEQFDLHDPATANRIYRSFLTQYPHDPLAVDVRAALDGHPVQEEVEEQPPQSRTQEPGTQTRTTEAGAQSPRIRSPRIQSLEKTTERAMNRSPAVETSARTDSSWQPDGVRVSQKNLLPMATNSAKSLPKATIQNVRYWAEGKSTRLAVDMSDPVPYRTYSSKNGKQITLIFFGTRSGAAAHNPAIAAAHDANLSSMHISMLSSDQTALVLELKHPVGLSSFVLSHPSRLILDLKPEPAVEVAHREAHSTSSEVAAMPKPAKPAAAKVAAKEEAIAGVKRSMDAKNPAGSADPVQTSPDSTAPQTMPIESDAGSQQSMTRILGLRVRRIVIDAGHGGHDSGTIGPDGLEEKDVALGVALRLGHLLRQRLGAEVIYTRQSDNYVSLEERTAIANKAHADLFLSIHANSSSDPKVRGVETYFLNFTSSRMQWRWPRERMPTRIAPSMSFPPWCARSHSATRSTSRASLRTMCSRSCMKRCHPAIRD